MVTLKKIRFDNPDLYKIKTLEIGDTILLSSEGMCTITHAKDGYFYCGGMPLHFQTGTVYDKVFKKEFLTWIDSLSNKFKKGDVVIGFNGERKYVIGKFMDNACQRITKGKLWIETDSVTTAIDVLSAKKIELEGFRTYHE